MKKWYSRKDTLNMSVEDWAEMIDSIMMARDDISDSDRDEIKKEYEDMDIDELISDYILYTGNLIFETPKK